MSNIKRVMDYGNINYYQALDMPIDLYLLMLKLSIIDELNKSEEGRDYLKKCERLNTTSIDKVAFRKKMRQEVV